MKRIQDDQIIERVVSEMEAEGRHFDVLDKHAFDLTMNPATIAGSVLGAVAGSRIGTQIENKNKMRRSLESISPTMSLGNNHYEEAQNLAQNLYIVFTPLSVVYMVKMNNQQISIDTIDTGEMDDEMYDAWRRRDSQYFKNLMLNKAMSEIQLVEQMYAKRLLQKQMEIESAIRKHSAEGWSEDEQPEEVLELEPSEVLEGVVTLREACEKSPSFLSAMLDGINGDVDYKLSLELERPIDKYAGVLSGALHFFGMNTDKQQLEDLQKKYLNPSYLAGRMKTAFLPDRVLFIVDGVVVTQLAAVDMNEEGFTHFEEKDDPYFRRLFVQKTKQGKREMNQPVLEKKAAETGSMAELFSDEDVHPVVYDLVLRQQYGDAWDDFDPEVLVREIEEDFELTEPIGDFALNKIFMIQVLKNSPLVLQQPLYFEKCVRAFAGKPVDFNMWEPDISGEEIFWTLHVMTEFVPMGDLFSYLSEEVQDYIVMSLANQEHRSISLREPILNSVLEKQFFDTLNEDLSAEWGRMATEKARSDKEVSAAIGINASCVAMTKTILSGIRANPNFNLADANSIVQQVGEKAGVSATLINLTKKNVRLNLGIDLMIDAKEADLQHQKATYRI